MSYFVGVDVGTSIVKSVLFDETGSELRVFSESNTVHYPQPGWAECDMDEVWMAASTTLARIISFASDSGYAVDGIGITGQGDGTWLVTKAGEPAGPAIIWLDGRSGEDLAKLQEKRTDRAVFDITGTMLNTSHQGMQLRWLRAHAPETLSLASVALRAKDWIFFCLTGELRTDYTDASHSYFDLNTGTYSEALLDLLEISEFRHLLPEALPCYRNSAPIRSDRASEFGIVKDTPVFCGPLDVAASALGVGAVKPGDACSILGTAGIHQFVTDSAIREPAHIGYTMHHAPPDTWIRFLPTMTGTLNLEWFLSTIFAPLSSRDEESWGRIERTVAKQPIGANGVRYHPFIDSAGERAPFVKPSARAQFTGLSATTSAADLLRAVFEGVALSAADCYDHLSREIKTVRLTGGGARSPSWAQIIADAIGASVEIVGGNETGARGAAINVMVGLGVYPDFQSACKAVLRVERSYAPDMERAYPAYRELLNLYRRTYEAMFPIWDQNYTVTQRLSGGQQS